MNTTAHAYRANGRPWQLGIGFDNHTCTLPAGDLPDVLDAASLELAARGYRRIGGWVRDEQARIEKWSAPIEASAVNEEA